MKDLVDLFKEPLKAEKEPRQISRDDKRARQRAVQYAEAE